MVAAFLLHWLLPAAHAVSLQQIGIGKDGKYAPGISDMWAKFSDLFPFARARELTPDILMSRIAYLVLALIGFTAVALLVYAGARLSAAGWNEEGLTEAKRILKNVGIGLIAALLADFLLFGIAGVISEIAAH